MSWFSSRGTGPRHGKDQAPPPAKGAATAPPKPAQAEAQQGSGSTGVARPAPSASPATPGAGHAAHPAHPPRGGHQPTTAPHAEHRSLALAALLQSFAGRSRLQILDLGPAVGGNVEFLSRYGCKLYIQDLYGALAPHLSLAPAAPPNPTATSLGSVITADRASAREARASWEAREERHATEGDHPDVVTRLGELLQFPPGTELDAVLAWDLLNYMDRREVAALARLLVPVCRPGALLFALVSILKLAPAEPLRFRILDGEHLSYEARSAVERPCPRYAPAELAELLRGFRLDRSYLMRHGVQEYLFARE